jgi:hypothetical protein
MASCAGFKPRGDLAPFARGVHDRYMDLHGLAEERSLAYHRRVAELLSAQPELLAAARERARDWATSGARYAPYAQEWLRLLALPLEQLAAQLVDPSQQGRDLRQATPFAGALPPRERWKLWKEVRAAWEAR